MKGWSLTGETLAEWLAESRFNILAGFDIPLAPEHFLASPPIFRFSETYFRVREESKNENETIECQNFVFSAAGNRKTGSSYLAFIIQKKFLSNEELTFRFVPEYIILLNADILSPFIFKDPYLPLCLGIFHVARHYV